ARLIVVVAALLATAALAESWPAEVMQVKLERGKSIALRSTVERGVAVHNMAMASCIAPSMRESFRAPMQLFAISIPANAVLHVTATPTKKHGEVSVFAYGVEAHRFDMPDSRGTPLQCQWATRGPPSSKQESAELTVSGGPADE